MADGDVLTKVAGHQEFAAPAGGLPTGWTQDPESGLVDTGGQDFTAYGVTATNLTAPTSDLAAVLAAGADGGGADVSNLNSLDALALTIDGDAVATEDYVDDQLLTADQKAAITAADMPSETNQFVTDSRLNNAIAAVPIGVGAPSGAPGAGILPFWIPFGTDDLYVWDGTEWHGPYVVTP